MSAPVVETFEYLVAVTKSDTVNDPAGPFAALYVAAAGNVVILQQNGPQTAVTVAVVAGTYLRVPVRRVNSTSTTATVFGLIAGAVVPQGFA